MKRSIAARATCKFGSWSRRLHALRAKARNSNNVQIEWGRAPWRSWDWWWVLLLLLVLCDAL